MKFEVTSTAPTEHSEHEQRLLDAYCALETALLIFDARLELVYVTGNTDRILAQEVKAGMVATEIALSDTDGTLNNVLCQAAVSSKAGATWYRNQQGDSLFAKCAALQDGSTAVHLTRVAPHADQATAIWAGCRSALQEFERMPPPHKLYVLIVDDDDDSRYIIINNLQASNACQYSVAVAPSSAKALEMLRENHFDICITDFRLMDETAIELHRHSQSLDNPPPFIVVTNYPEDTLYAKLLNEGITDLMSKSEVTPELLSRSIRYAVQKHRLVLDLKKQLIG